MADLPEEDDISLFERAPVHTQKKTADDQYVINSKGEKEHVDLRKILDNIEFHCKGLDVQPHLISSKVIGSFKPGCTTSDLRMESVKEAHNFSTHTRDYKILACRLYLSDLYRKTPNTFTEAMDKLGEGQILNDEFWGFIKENKEELDKLTDIKQDQRYNFLSLSTFSQLYMLKVDNKPVERPQYCFLRIAIGLSYPRVHKGECRCPKCEPHTHYVDDLLDAKPKYEDQGDYRDGCTHCFERMLDKLNKTHKFEEQITFGKPTEETWAKIKKRYYRLSHLHYTHASPTMFNMGTKCQQCSSCFLLAVSCPFFFSKETRSVMTVWMEFTRPMGTRPRSLNLEEELVQMAAIFEPADRELSLPMANRMAWSRFSRPMKQTLRKSLLRPFMMTMTTLVMV